MVCAVLALSMTACDDAADEGDSGGDEYTFDYEDGRTRLPTIGE